MTQLSNQIMKYISNTKVPLASIGFHGNMNESYMSKQTSSKTVSWEMKWVMRKYLTKLMNPLDLVWVLLIG